MASIVVTAEKFAELASEAWSNARRDALAKGNSVRFLDAHGRRLEERPDGRIFEVIEDSAGNDVCIELPSESLAL